MRQGEGPKVFSWCKMKLMTAIVLKRVTIDVVSKRLMEVLNSYSFATSIRLGHGRRFAGRCQNRVQKRPPDPVR